MGLRGKKPSDVVERFWAKVQRSDGCWEWSASLMKSGYGQFNKGGRVNARAHRVAWELTFGDPGAMSVCHRCDNRKCCRPDHLFLGTYAGWTDGATVQSLAKEHAVAFPVMWWTFSVVRGST